VKVRVSQVERAAIAAIFGRPGSWGGSDVVLLAQDDLYRALQLVEFEGLQEIPIADLQTDLVEVEIPDAAAPVLRGMLGSPGQNPNAGRIIAPILRRLL